MAYCFCCTDPAYKHSYEKKKKKSKLNVMGSDLTFEKNNNNHFIFFTYKLSREMKWNFYSSIGVIYLKIIPNRTEIWTQIFVFLDRPFIYRLKEVENFSLSFDACLVSIVQCGRWRVP